tara:strand:- start:55 stop:591 length:537 start_codon:yes stop_codon:yes gene_type:complete
MKVTSTELDGVVIIEPDVYGDERGFFKETYHEERYKSVAGIHEKFVQDNFSRSTQGVLRGLHLQKSKPQGKLVSVSHGEVFDVAADIDENSSTFGKWVGVKLSAQNHFQLYIPPGYAHGFIVLSSSADFLYKCTDFYNPSDELTIRWDDPTLNIKWPDKNPKVSEKDSKGKTLKEFTA